MKEIQLTRGKVALVDDEDYERVSQVHWCLDKGVNTFYARTYKRIGKKKISIRMHRLILNAPKGMEVDHKDGNGLNNQKENIRLCTHAENQQNKQTQKNNTSGYIGVQWSEDKKRWVVYLTVNKKQKYFGSFRDKVEAAKAHDKATLKYRGEFAFLNFSVAP